MTVSEPYDELPKWKEWEEIKRQLALALDTLEKIRDADPDGWCGVEADRALKEIKGTK